MLLMPFILPDPTNQDQDCKAELRKIPKTISLKIPNPKDSFPKTKQKEKKQEVQLLQYL